LGIKQFNFFVFIFNRELFAGMWLESKVFSPHNLTSTECEETSVTEDMGISQRSISNGFIYVVDAHFIDKIERKQNNLDPSACGQILPQVCKIRVYILSTLEMFHESLYERQTLIFNY
jgi:hypothetical protein